MKNPYILTGFSDITVPVIDEYQNLPATKDESSEPVIINPTTALPMMPGNVIDISGTPLGAESIDYEIQHSVDMSISDCSLDMSPMEIIGHDDWMDHSDAFDCFDSTDMFSDW